MWLYSSSAPISTIRSPCSGSNPVVSVSRTISRIFQPVPYIPDHILNLPAGILKGVGLDHVVGAAALFGIGHLARADILKRLRAHCAAVQHSLALNLGGYGDAGHR